MFSVAFRLGGIKDASRRFAVTLWAILDAAQTECGAKKWPGRRNGA
jgi:hypothetical protein